MAGSICAPGTRSGRSGRNRPLREESVADTQLASDPAKGTQRARREPFVPTHRGRKSAIWGASRLSLLGAGVRLPRGAPPRYFFAAGFFIGSPAFFAASGFCFARLFVYASCC